MSTKTLARQREAGGGRATSPPNSEAEIPASKAEGEPAHRTPPPRPAASEAEGERTHRSHKDTNPRPATSEAEGERTKAHERSAGEPNTAPRNRDQSEKPHNPGKSKPKETRSKTKGASTVGAWGARPPKSMDPDKGERSARARYAVGGGPLDQPGGRRERAATCSLGASGLERCTASVHLAE